MVQQVCVQCVMDTTDPDIIFDNDGVCNHCHKFDRTMESLPDSNEEKTKKLNAIISMVKENGRGKKYDCIIGVSGGVDSTYVAYLVKKLGLRPLAVHLDNGWNSELAVSNVEKLLKQLDIDLFTYVLNWEEFKDLQLSFLKASVPHAEHPTDHAISALLYQIAARENVKYIIRGSNMSTEGYGVVSWSGGQKDWKYIKNIHQSFGNKKLKTFPKMTMIKLAMYTGLRKIQIVDILDYIQYEKETAKKTIQEELGWKDYGGKHFESIWTRFFQSYILPIKYNMDKRKIHLSPMIRTGQLSREEALEELKHDIYSPEQLNEDKEFVLKKFSLRPEEFEALMSKPNKTFNDYKSYENSWYFQLVKKIYLNLFKSKHRI